MYCKMYKFVKSYFKVDDIIYYVFIYDYLIIKYFKNVRCINIQKKIYINLSKKSYVYMIGNICDSKYS